ncbi:MAG: nitrite/sulfite reductase [Candidatus Korobacteraceae bacterium]|jgi:sulfite reductase (ferredoxin)
MAEQSKETKAQKVERLKREKDPWERLDEIREFARQGHGSIPAEWLSTYFRFWGIYTQGDGAGAIGGKGGEGMAVPFFMVRIRIPNGFLSSDQARTIAALSARYGRGVADITVRQNIQLHWVRIEELPDVIEQLWRAGLNTLGACGDVTRNITGCPLAGVDGDEVFDASAVVLELNRFFVGNSDFRNLPRKFKISVTGCRSWCTYPEINDIGLTGIIRRRGDRDEHGFSLRIGGGLSTQPHLAVRLNAFIRLQQAVPVVRSIAEIFRDAGELRESREQARLKFLFLKHGWTADTFLAEINRRLGFELDPAEPEDPPSDVFRDHVGIHAQREPGHSYVGAAVLRGRLSAEQLRLAADLTDRFAKGELRTTAMQNLIVVNVPNEDAAALARELEAIGLRIEGSPFWRGAIACTGTEFCKLAITETKGFARWVVEELEERLPGFDQQLKLNITGCPNSCGQHWIADLGLEGKKIKINGRMADAYYFCVGGAVGREQSIARAVGYRCLASEVPDAIARLLSAYNLRRNPEENLRQFFSRHSNDEIRGFLAGGVAAPVPRDLPTATTPHGIEG